MAAAVLANVSRYSTAQKSQISVFFSFIVANQVGGGKGFDSDQNAVNVYWKAGEQSFSTAEKTELARDVLKLIAERYEIEYSAGKYAIN